MAGIGDSWGTKEELLHPRGPDGRWIRSAGVAKSAIQAVLGFLAAFRPRTFQNRSQASQYLQNTSRRPGARRMGRPDLVRLSSDLSAANADLRDGVIDEPSTKKFVDMMDRSATELPDDVILTRIVGVDAFGFTPETAKGTDSTTDPGIRSMSGKLIADRAYGLTTVGGPEGPAPAGSVRMVIAAKKGTKAIIPAAGPNDTTLLLDRGQPLRVTKVAPDGAGGWTMYVTADAESGQRDVPEPIGGPVGVRQPSKDREARISESMQSLAKLDKVPDEEKERQQEQRNAEERAKMGAPVPSPQQEAERRRVEQLTQQPAPGEPPPRTEPPVGRVGEAPATGGPQPTPGATVPEAPATPRRAVDLRLAVRDAKVPSPSAGPRRKAWNEAYLGVTGGKKDPIDAVRELDADIATLRSGAEIGRPGENRGESDEARGPDIDALQQLRDVIAKEYGLEQPASAPEKRTAAGLPKAERPEPVKTKLSKREQEAAERNQEAAKETPPAPTPVKKAPAAKAAKKTAGASIRTKDQEDRILSQAKKLSGPPRNDEERRLLDEAAEISTRRQEGATARRQAGTSTVAESPMKVFAKKAPAKKAAPGAPGDDLDKMTKAQLLEAVRAQGSEGRQSWSKDRLKSILRGEGVAGLQPGQSQHEAGRILPRLEQGAKPGAEVVDLTPEVRERRRREAEALQREQEAGQATPEKSAKELEDEANRLVGDRSKTAEVRRLRAQASLKRKEEGGKPLDLDKMSKAELIAEAGRRGVTARESWTKDKIKAAMRQREESAAQAPEAPAPVKKAAKKTAPRKLNSRNLNPGDRVIWEPPGEEPVHGVVDQQGTRTFVNWEGGRREQVTSTGDGSMGPNVRLATPEEIEEHGTLGPPKEAPRAPAAKAAVPGAAPGTAAGKITAGRLQPGMRILVTAQGNPTNRKTGQRTLTIESVDRVTGGRASSGAPSSRSRIRIIGRDEDGNQVQVPGDAAPSQTFIVAPEPGAAPAKKVAKAAAPDSVERARARQEEIFEAKRFADTAAELDQLITDEASDKAILARFDRATANEGTGGGAMDVVRGRLEAGDRDGARAEMRRILEANGVTPTGNAGDTVKYNPRLHQTIGGSDISEGDTVQIVRPGHRVSIRGEDVELGRPVVERVDPAREKGPDLVPEGSVAGPRTETPVDNAPRKRELRQAWIAADTPIPPPGSGRKSHEEIKGDLVAGRITPEEAIRRYESEVAFNKEDLAEVDAHLRETDLGPDERSRVERHRTQLQATIDAHEAQSTFLREYFKDEAPVIGLKEAKVQDPESYEFLKDATPDDMKEVAKEAGLDQPSGDTADEMFTDLIKQMARQTLERKKAKKAPAKAAKKAAPPAVPKERERIDARLVGAGIEFDENDKWVKDTLDRVQKDLDGDEKTPAAIGRELDDAATRRMTTAVYEHGQWHSQKLDDGIHTPEENAARAAEHKAEYDRVKVEAEKIRELGKRLEKTRRKPVKRAAPATPEVAKLQDKVDDLEKRRIDDVLGELSQSGDNRDRADAALEGLTMEELRRLADQSGVENARTKRKLRDNILDRFVPRQEVTLDQFHDLPSREAAHELLAPLNRDQLARLARQLSVPGASSASKESLRREIVEGTTGRRLDSIATRGFRGARPGLGDVQGRPDLPTVGATPAPRPQSLSRRASGAGIATPSRMFSDVDSSVGEADRMLQRGDSPTAVSRFLRERAARVAKADINEEGRRFPVEIDKPTLLSIRKSNAEYLRRVATHVQQEGKATKATPAKKAAPSAPEAPSAPSPSRTGTSPAAPRPTGLSPHPNGPVSGGQSTGTEIPNNWGMLGTGGDVEFHADGVIGQGLERMREDRLMDVDGEPLSNVVGKLATRAVRGQISQEQLLDELQRLAQRLPEGSAARRGINSMIKDLDAPKRDVDLPQGTPAPFDRAMKGLLRIPVAREAVSRPGFHRDREDSEVDKLLRLIQDFQEGNTGGLRMINEIQEMRGSLPHESQEGRFEADRVLRQLHDDLEALYKDKDTRSQVMRREPGAAPPPVKKATPRLTAIPGGGAGGGRKKPPKLTVVRNENGEFTLVWDEGDDHVQLPKREQHPSDLYTGSTV